MKSNLSKKISSKFTRILDFYFRFPILLDIIISLTICLLHVRLVSWQQLNIKLCRDTMNNLLNELVSSSFSIAGFVLAGLTVLMGLKEGTRNLESEIKAKSGVEFFFNSYLYELSVKVFFRACLIFIFMFLLFTFLEIFNGNLSDKELLYTLVFGVSISSLTIFRVLYVLSRVFRLHINNKKHA
jgi:hypothetical protein